MDTPCPTLPPPDVDYLAWHRDADRRHARGERQQFCGACQRYRWPDERGACPQFVRDVAHERAQARAARERGR